MKNSIIFCFLFALAIFLDSLCIPPSGDYQLCLGLGLGLAIAGGASLLGSIIGAEASESNTDSVNSANLQAARETNALNRDMFNRQMDYNKYMYEDQKAYNDRLIAQMNDYNSPVAQRQRFEAAGINPYFALGNIQAGNAQSQVGVSTPSAPASPQMVTPTAQTNQVGSIIAGAGRDLASVMQAYSSAENLQAQTQQTMIDNLTRFDENIARLESIRANSNLSKAQIDSIDEQITDMRQTRAGILEQLNLSNNKLRSESEVADLQVKRQALENRSIQLANDYQEWQNSYVKKYGAKQIQQLDAMIQNLNADSAVKNMQKLESECRAKGIKLDNEQKKRLMPLLERQQQLENERRRIENKYGSNWYQSLARKYDEVQNQPRINMEKRFGLNRTVRW